MSLQYMKKAAARYRLDLAYTQDLIDAAHATLDRGTYSYSLGELATIKRSTFSECAPLFEAALKELGIEVPDVQKAVDELVLDYCVRMFERRVEPFNIVQEIRIIHNTVVYGGSESKISNGNDLQIFLNFYYALEEARDMHGYLRELD